MMVDIEIITAEIGPCKTRKYEAYFDSFDEAEIGREKYREAVDRVLKALKVPPGFTTLVVWNWAPQICSFTAQCGAVQYRLSMRLGIGFIPVELRINWALLESHELSECGPEIQRLGQFVLAA